MSKRIPEKPPVPTLDDLRQSVKLWTLEIENKCRTSGMAVDVVVCVKPFGERTVVRATGQSIPRAREMLREAEAELALREMVVGRPGGDP